VINAYANYQLGLERISELRVQADRRRRLSAASAIPDQTDPVARRFEWLRFGTRRQLQKAQLV
jgi:hypothetical protein